MPLDLIVRNVRMQTSPDTALDIGIAEGRIAVVAEDVTSDAPTIHADGRLAVPGFVETHIHLDKSCLLGTCRCETGSLQEAIGLVARAKQRFTCEDVLARATRCLEMALVNGTMAMRTHVEVDPRVGLTSFHALKELKRRYSWAIDLQLCVFPQEGLLDDPGCEDVMRAALREGADVVGGAPYMDRDSHGQIARIFAMALDFDLDIDFHLDFGLDPSHFDLEEVCRLTELHGWGGRVAIGHVTKLSSVPRVRMIELAARLAGAGVAVTVLPATDLYLTGRDHDHDVPRGVTPAHLLLEQGVTCSVSTNNVLNPFTPFGDCSLVRMANLYANIAQVGSDGGLAACLDMITEQPSKLMRLAGYGLEVGKSADLVLLDCRSPVQAVAEIAAPLLGLKRGVRTFSRSLPILHRPAI